MGPKKHPKISIGLTTRILKDVCVPLMQFRFPPFLLSPRAMQANDDKNSLPLSLSFSFFDRISQMATQMSMMMTSMPLPSPPSNL